ncbi:TetR/AcrR family transcriptional regulator [Pseudomonas sp. MYb185]|uniref:TetR/AcrR family transcriptional regulator n=1 Tax=Pseudomonas sp. MYb185 TaxID=1848729 RepID=UPI000CFE0927|nr:TetR/AcrR family transcriptional regulator [Pseudomonas sp. MYb185]PRB82860.1 TetR family transcriptional regulator [Pseudomonas sp. MYb185]
MTNAEQNSKEQAVLAAARTVFFSHGFSAATTDMIQREAGVSKATMYSCFPNKEALFVAVIEQQCAAMTTAIQAIEISPGNLTKTLTDIGRTYLQVVLSPGGIALFRVVGAEAPRLPELGRRFFLAGPRSVTSMVAARVSEAAQAGEIDVQAVGVEAAAGLFISMVRGEGQIELLMHPEAQPSSAQIDQWVQLAVTTFMKAFGVK